MRLSMTRGHRPQINENPFIDEGKKPRECKKHYSSPLSSIALFAIVSVNEQSTPYPIGVNVVVHRVSSNINT